MKPSPCAVAPRWIVCLALFAVLSLMAATAGAVPVSQPVSFGGAGNSFNGNVTGVGALTVSGNATLDITGSVNILGTAVSISAPTGDVDANAIPSTGVVGGSFTSTPSGNATVIYQDNFSRQNGPVDLVNGPDGRADEGNLNNSMMAAAMTNLNAALISNASVVQVPGANPYITATLTYDLFSLDTLIAGDLDVDYVIPLRFDILPNLSLQNLNYTATSNGAFANPTAISTFGDGAHPSGNTSIEDLSVQYSGVDAASVGTTTGNLTGGVNVQATAQLSQAVVRVDLEGNIIIPGGSFDIAGGLFGDFSTTINNAVTGINLGFNDTASGFVNGTTTFREVPTIATTPQYDDLQVQTSGNSFQSASGFALNNNGTLNFPSSSPLSFNQVVPVDVFGLFSFNLNITGDLIGALNFNLNSNLLFNAVNYNFAPPTIADAVNAGPDPTFSNNNLNFGFVLVGTTGTQTAVVTNTTSPVSSLTGTFGGTPGGDEFSPDSASGPFVINTTGGTATQNYDYSPINRGTDTSSATVNTNGGNGTITMQGTGVAPVNQLSTTNINIGNVRIGTTGNGGVTVNNIGDGNLSGLGAVSNLNGSVGGATAPEFGGAGGGLSLPDGGSAPFNYTYTPADHGTDTDSVLAQFTNGHNSGSNQAQNVAVGISGTGVGPEFGASQPVNSTIDFGNVMLGLHTLPLMVSNVTLDSALLGNALVGLTLLSYAITGPDAADFGLAGFTPGTVLSPGDDLNLLVQFNAMLPFGPRNATLTFFTDQNAAFGASGSSFSFNLQANVVPEPSSLVVWGLLGGVTAAATWRRRRRS